MRPQKSDEINFSDEEFKTKVFPDAIEYDGTRTAKDIKQFIDNIYLQSK